MEVLAVHAASLTIAADQTVEWMDEETARTETDGAIVAVTGVEPGDRAAIEIVTRAAATDLAALADEFGVETVVVVPSTHRRAGLSETPGPVLESLGEALSPATVVVPAHAYPELAATGTAHPTALQFRRYDGWLPSRSELVAPHWSSPPDEPTTTLQNAGVLSEDDPTSWTPAGQFLIDALLEHTRERALVAGACIESVRDRTGGPPAIPPVDRDGQLQYGVRTLPDGVRPVLSCRVTTETQLRDCCRTLLSVLEAAAAVFEQPLQASLGQAEATEYEHLAELFDDALDVVSVTDATALPEPATLALTVGIERKADLAAEDPTVVAIGTLVVASLGDTWCLQCAPLGRLDRTLAALLEGPRPILPASIAPTQLRLVPVSPEQYTACEEAADCLGSVRVDVDDRSMPVDDRLRTTRQEGVPYYAVVGRRETESDTLSVTNRQSREQRQIAVESIRESFAGLDVEDTKQRYGPLWLSQR